MFRTRKYQNIFRVAKPIINATYSKHSSVGYQYKFNELKDKKYIVNYPDAGPIAIINGVKEIKKQQKLLNLKEIEAWSKSETQIKKFKWVTRVISFISGIIFLLIINNLLFLIFPVVIGIFIYLRLYNKLRNKIEEERSGIRHKNFSKIASLEDKYAHEQLKESFTKITSDNDPKKNKHIIVKSLIHNEEEFNDITIDCYEWNNIDGRTLKLEELEFLFQLKSQLRSFEYNNQRSKSSPNFFKKYKNHYIFINDLCFYVEIDNNIELDIYEKNFYYHNYLKPFSGKLDNLLYVDGCSTGSVNEMHEKETIKESDDLDQENEIYEVIAEEREYYEVNNPENTFWGYLIDIHIQDVGMHIEGVDYYGSYPVVEAKDNNDVYNYYIVKDIPYEVETENINRFHHCGEFKTEEAAKIYLDDIKVMKYKDALKRGLIPAPFKNE